MSRCICIRLAKDTEEEWKVKSEKPVSPQVFQLIERSANPCENMIVCA